MTFFCYQQQMKMSTIKFVIKKCIPPIFKNPKCVNCKYYKQTLLDSDKKMMNIGICERFEYMIAHDCRVNEYKCGIDGKYFKMKKL